MNQEDRDGYKIVVDQQRKSSPEGRGYEKLGSLLDEVNVVYSKQRKQFTDDEATQLIDMNFAKKVMKSMNSEQQGLVEQLLSKLKIEQIMRLQSEEQSDQMMQQMVLNQQ